MNRNKIFPILILLILSVLLFPAKSFAEAINLPDGFIISDDQGLSVTKNGRYFFQLNDLFPGDTITRKLTIKNTSAEDHTLIMYIEPISSEGPANLLKNMEMKLTYAEDLIFDGNLVNQDKNVTDIGTEIDFGVIKGQSETPINIEITVLSAVPWEHFVRNQSKANVRWVFEAKRSKDKVPPDPIPPKPTVKPIKKLLQTGEEKMLILTLIGLGIVGVVWILYYFWNRKKKSEKPV